MFYFLLDFLGFDSFLPIKTNLITRSAEFARWALELLIASCRDISLAQALANPSIPCSNTPRASSVRAPPMAIVCTFCFLAALATPEGVLPKAV